MSRTSWRKLCGVLVAVAAIVGFKALFAERGLYPLPASQRLPLQIAVFSLFILPAFSLRQLFAARRFIKKGEFAQGEAEARAFIDEMRAKPWKVRVAKLLLEVYTTEPIVHGYTCLGTAQLLQGKVDQALAAFRTGCEIDPLSPMPVLGLAAVAQVQGDEALAQAWQDRCVELGYSGSIIDKLCMAGGKHLSVAVLATPGGSGGDLQK